MFVFSRNKIQEGDKRIGEVLEWYEEVNSQTLNYVTFSIHDSDISDFYRWADNGHTKLRQQSWLLGLGFVLLSSDVFGRVTLINTNQMEDFLCGHIDS